MSLADKKNNEVQTILSTSSKILLILEALETTNFVFVTCVDTYLLGLWDGKLDTLGWFLSFFFFFVMLNSFIAYRMEELWLASLLLLLALIRRWHIFFQKYHFQKETQLFMFCSAQKQKYICFCCSFPSCSSAHWEHIWWWV